MDELFLLSERQMRRISPYFLLSHGIPRVDDRRVVSGIVHVIHNGLQWKDVPRAYGPSARGRRLAITGKHASICGVRPVVPPRTVPAPHANRARASSRTETERIEPGSPAGATFFHQAWESDRRQTRPR